MWGSLLSAVGTTGGQAVASSAATTATSSGGSGMFGSWLSSKDGGSGEQPYGAAQVTFDLGNDALMQSAMAKAKERTMGLPKSLMELYLQSKADLLNSKLKDYRR